LGDRENRGGILGVRGTWFREEENPLGVFIARQPYSKYELRTIDIPFHGLLGQHSHL